MGETFDIIVVGGGGTGLMAALAATRLGRRVLLLEKNAKLGGTTGLSVGSISTTSTPHQRAQAILDTPQAHFEDMALFAGSLAERDNLELRRLLVEEVPETFKELIDTGITFMGPMPEPPHRQPRLHAIVPHSKGYIHHLASACRRHGAEIRCGMRVEALVRDDGRIGGVEVTGRGGPGRKIRARQAVILATGDFSSASRDYRARFLDETLLDVEGANPASTGDGQRLGEAAGGEVVNGDLVWGPEIRFVAPARPALASRLPAWRPLARAILLAMRILPDPILRPFLMSFVTTFLAPSPNLFRHGALLIDKTGKRLCDELDRPQDRIPRAPDGIGYILMDGTIASAFESWPNFVSTAPGVGYAYLGDYVRSRPDITRVANSLDELAEKLRMEPSSLRATVATHNGSAGNRPKLLSPPFHALGPVRSWIMFGEGGLRVDRRLRVLDRERQPIGGLYAAGSCGQGGLILEGHGHHLGWAFTSGRLAGRHAALDEIPAAQD